MMNKEHNKLLLIPWMIDKDIVKGIPKQEIMKSKYFENNGKTIVYDFLGYSHSLSILEAITEKKKIKEIFFFGAAAFSGDYKVGEIVYPLKNFIFLKYEDRISQTEELLPEIKQRIEEKITKTSAPSMTVDYAGFFPLEEFRKIGEYKNNLLIEMEWGFIFRWAKRHNIKAYPVFILTDKWGEKPRINNFIKEKFKDTYLKILEEM